MKILRLIRMYIYTSSYIRILYIDESWEIHAYMYGNEDFIYFTKGQISQCELIGQISISIYVFTFDYRLYIITIYINESYSQFFS